MAKKSKKQTPQARPKSKGVKSSVKKAVAKPTKKQPVQKVKDPKKVKAGKIRQATGIKDEKGRFASNIFVNEVKKTLLATKKVDVSKINSDQSDKIDKLLKEAKITPAQVKRFYDTHKDIFDELKEKGKLKGTSKNSGQIEKSLSKYKGKIIIQDEKGNQKEVTPAQAKYRLVRLKNALQSSINVVDFAIRPNLELDGKMILKIPSVTAVLKDLREALGLEAGQDFDDIDSRDIAEALQDILNGYYDDESDIIFYIS